MVWKFHFSYNNECISINGRGKNFGEYIRGRQYRILKWKKQNPSHCHSTGFGKQTHIREHKLQSWIRYKIISFVSYVFKNNLIHFHTFGMLPWFCWWYMRVQKNCWIRICWDLIFIFLYFWLFLFYFCFTCSFLKAKK